METKLKQPLDDAGVLEAISQFEKSNMTVAEFCEYSEIDEVIFNQWQKRSHKLKNPRGNFRQLELPAELLSPSSAAGSYGELVLPGGMTLRFTSPIDPIFIKSLL